MALRNAFIVKEGTQKQRVVPLGGGSMKIELNKLEARELLSMLWQAGMELSDDESEWDEADRGLKELADELGCKLGATCDVSGRATSSTESSSEKLRGKRGSKWRRDSRQSS